MTDTTDVQALAARLRVLEAENAALTKDAQHNERPVRGWWRSVASALLVVTATILVPVSIVGAWARVQLVDEEAFVSTFSPLVDDPAVQRLIIDETMAAVRAQIDFAEITDTVFDGIVGLGMNERAAAAVGVLRQPAAAGLDNLVAAMVTTVIESDAFAEVWATSLRGGHRALTLASTSEDGGIVVLTPAGVGIAVGPLVEGVKEKLAEQGIGVATLIPPVDHTVIVGSGESLIAIRTGYTIVDAAGGWLPVITLASFAGAIALARRRNTAILGSGVGIAIGCTTLAVALTLGSLSVAMVANDLALAPQAIDVVYTQLVDDMRRTAWILALVGLLVATVGWLMGRSRAARRVRATVDALNASARRSLAERGLQPGAVGAWLGRHRAALRVAITILAVSWAFMIRPLSAGGIAFVLIVCLALAWVLELLQRRPGEERAIVDEPDETTHAVDSTEAR